MLGYLGVTGLMSARDAGARDRRPRTATSKLAADALESDAPAPEPGRPGDAGVRREPGVHVVRDGRRPAGPAIPGVGHLQLDERDRRAPGRAFLGQLPGGKIADFVKNEKQASWLFLASSIITLIVIPLDTQPEFLADMLFGGSGDSLLQQANSALEAGSGLDHDLAELAVPDLVRRHPGLFPARGHDGDGQPRRGQAGGRPAQEIPANRHRDRRRSMPGEWSAASSAPS